MEALCADKTLQEITAKHQLLIGPATKEERAKYDAWTRQKVIFLGERDYLLAKLETAGEGINRDELEKTEQVLEIIRQVLPD